MSISYMWAIPGNVYQNMFMINDVHSDDIPPINPFWRQSENTLPIRIPVPNIPYRFSWETVDLNGCPASHVAKPQSSQLWLFNTFQQWGHGTLTRLPIYRMTCTLW